MARTPRSGLEVLAQLPPAKAALARRLALRGAPLDPRVFTARGWALSPTEQALVEQSERCGAGSDVHAEHVAADGTSRMVLRLGDGALVETVALRDGALCVSSQVGCAVGCRFCASGLHGLRRNLAEHEILEQVLHARRRGHGVRRVVYMGMGEPSHNLDAVLAAAAVLHRDGGLAARRQTLSTVGGLRAFARLAAADVRPALAWSLHSAAADQRAWLLPHAPRDDLAALVRAAADYSVRANAPLQVEWTLLAGVNDRDADVDALCALLRGAGAYVNFIVWNAVPGMAFAPPARERVVELVRRAKRGGVFATIRDSAGADAEAACGQLRLRSL